ncbi:hypothetical protein KRZ98_04270 [Sphingobium sp. AS12]|uniref:COG3904 family protein n=1 Tax=Sphingobium sp. AS12 TaxID=2849495 RepID=UPI001C317938|nr:hypothetical protein [Sphingobium sp. AS12]MBV2147501.1 hypothetical protein [Sphingobium sp. AS12]
MRKAFWCVAGLLIALSQPSTAANITHRQVSDGFEAIIIDGAIEAPDLENFRALSIRYKEAIVILDSRGGALVPAIEIGKLIRLTGYSTLVVENGDCLSSCALIWLAGSKRLLSPKGRVGFHASYLDNKGVKQETGVGNAIVGHYLSLLNFPQKAVIFATSAGPEEINWLDNSNKAMAGIDFEDFIIGNSEVRQTPQTVRTPAPVAAARPSTPTSSRPISSYTLAEIEQSLRISMSKPETLDKMASSVKLDAAGTAVFRDHLLRIYSNGKLIHKLAEQLYNARASLSNELAYTMGREIGQATSMKLMFSGLSRLSDTDVRAFVSYMAAIPTKANAKECKAIFSQNNNDPMAEFRAVAASGSQALSSYLALMRKAIDAELADYPVKVAVSDNQKKLSDKAVEDAFAREFKGLKPSEVERVSKALSNFEAASDEDACDAYYLVFKVTSGLDGLPGDWYRRAFINSLNQN